MKSVIFLITFTVAFTSAQVMHTTEKAEKAEELEKWHKECAERTKVAPGLLLKLKSGYWQINNWPLKHWTLCLLIKYNIMSKEGVFKLDRALSMVPSADRAILEDSITECLPKVALKPSEAAWRYVKCYHAKTRNVKDKKLHYFELFSE